MIEIFEDNGKSFVDARETYDFLEVDIDFTTWITDRIERYQFTSGVDYVVLDGLPVLASGPHNKRDYAITVEMAKQLVMVENNRRGREARGYFISCEIKLGDVRERMVEVESNMEAIVREAKRLGIFPVREKEYRYE